MKRLSVVGLGKLGLPLAVFFASRGFEVIGVDIKAETIKAVNEKKCMFFEPGIGDLLKNSGDALIATDDYQYAIQNSEATFIVVSTPSEESGAFSTALIESACNKIAKSLKHKKGYHLIVLVSTVIPGSTERVKQLLEKVSTKKCGRDFGLCYNPEFIALGDILNGFAKPNFILIGESDPKSGELLAGIFTKACENNPPILRTNFYNAELGKILINSYVTMKISFANSMAEMCEKIPGGDVDVLSQILGLDPRVGRRFLTGGLSYGGPCFPRDNKAVSYFAQTIGIDAKLANTTYEVNCDQIKRVVELVNEKTGEVKGKKLAILGLTYKPNTDIVEESAALKIAQALVQRGARLSVYDPTGSDNTQKVLGRSVQYTNSVQQCLKGAGLCIIATPWEEFKKLNPEDFSQNMSKPVLLDCWRILDRAEFSDKLQYFAVGLGSCLASF